MQKQAQQERRPGRVPVATYRLQFNHGFTFGDAARVVPYLSRLGITDLYASPYLQARPGSVHGYDVFDHNSLNAEIGSEADHRALASVARKHDMGHLLDIVPNHMGVAGNGNAWWMDVLENGPSSPYSPFFDIDWYPLREAHQSKVLLPVLGDQFGLVLERGELRLAYADGRFRIHYFENEFPVAPRSSTGVLREALRRLRAGAHDEDAAVELESIMTALHHLPPRNRTDPACVAERQRERRVSQRRLAALHERSPEVRDALQQAVEHFNGSVDDPHSFDALHELLDDQAYRLAFWRVAAEEINYRRFFDINDLAGVRVERPEVFEATHRLILRLMAEGTVTGLRIDHPDGLFNPLQYLRDLQHAAAERTNEEPVYVLVEKILTGEEPLPPDWPVAGTVGYDFMNRVNGLFVDRANEAAMDDAYSRFTRRTPDFEELVYSRKKLILRNALASELSVLSHLLDRLSDQNRRVRDFTLGSLTEVLRETIACFPVYRTYVDARTGSVSETDGAYVEQAIRTARRMNPAISRSIFEFLRDLLLLRWPQGLDEETRSEHARFVMKFQQLTGPVMAKGVEDTSFYIYNRLVSLNEVGGEPQHFGVEPAEFHRWVLTRQAAWPHAMNASSTHDTKRSEDVRARIDVLSEMPQRWAEHALRWAELHAALRPDDGDGGPVPTRNDEYLLYQTLVGVWPLDGARDDESLGDVVARVQQYMEKATREAKVNTSWINPNDAYDEGLRRFVASVLDRRANTAFFEDFIPLQAAVARLGMLNSLSQTLVKIAAPGVPDVYQGQELWDLSLVDPDNRRPVDYDTREAMLASLAARRDGGAAAQAVELVREWTDGRIKLLVTHRALEHRRAHPALYLEGEYLPLHAHGARAAHVVAFARRHGERRVVVVVPRLVAGLFGDDGFGEDAARVWADTELRGPAELLDGLIDHFTGERPRAAARDGGQAAIPLAELLGRFPVALLSP
jgi:(1->4)-alpha-D-glucan 1-alpha-D-glucosylmutase